MPEAAEATGTFAIASKLPGLAGSVGTAAQPAPNWASIGAALDGAPVVAIGAPVVIGAEDWAGAAVSSEEPQAARERASAVAAATAANLVRNMSNLLQSVRTPQIRSSRGPGLVRIPIE
ncbi:hypothetical protein GCM10020218_042090 [Dactylosporangium vinaceum]